VPQLAARLGYRPTMSYADGIPQAIGADMRAAVQAVR
jgi:hypothetical protein